MFECRISPSGANIGAVHTENDDVYSCAGGITLCSWSGAVIEGEGDIDAFAELPARAKLSATARAERIPADGVLLMPLFSGRNDDGMAMGDNGVLAPSVTVP